MNKTLYILLGKCIHYNALLDSKISLRRDLITDQWSNCEEEVAIRG